MVVRLIVVAAAALLCLSTFDVAAQAGTYTAYSCRTPSGHIAPTTGWSEDLDAPSLGTPIVEGSSHFDTCATGGNLGTALYGNQAWKPGDRTSLRYDAPFGTTLAGFRVNVCGVAFAPITGVSVTWPTAAFASAAGFRTQYTTGAAWLGCGNALVATDISTTQVWFTSTCLAGTSCVNDDGIDRPNGFGTDPVDAPNIVTPPGCQPYPECRTASMIRVTAFAAIIRDGAAPVVTTASGPLTTGGLHSGTESVTYNASDAASGIYRVVAEAKPGGQGEWQILSSHVVDTNGGRCVDAGEDAQNDYEFTSPTPCKGQVSDASVAVDTTQLPAGDNLLHIYVEDASGNRADVVPVRTFSVVARVGAVTSSGPALVASNGTRASRTAAVKLLGGTRRRAQYGHRVTLRGRLVTENGRPIGNATLELAQRAFIPDRGSTNAPWTTVGTVRTNDRGRFTARVPAKVSRSLLFVYKANVNDPGWTSTAQVDVVVSAGVDLRVRRSHVRNKHTAVFVGHVAGAPRSGVLVTIQVRLGSEWAPVPTKPAITKTRPDGTFVAKYRFRRTFTAATFQFRAVANPDSAFAYAAGRSNVVEVHVRP